MNKIVFGIVIGLVVVSAVGVIAGRKFHRELLADDIFPEDWGWTW